MERNSTAELRCLPSSLSELFCAIQSNSILESSHASECDPNLVRVSMLPLFSSASLSIPVSLFGRMFIIILIGIVTAIVIVIGAAIGVVGVVVGFAVAAGVAVVLSVVLLALLALRLGLLRERIARAAAAAGILNQQTLLDQRLDVAIGGVLR